MNRTLAPSLGKVCLLFVCTVVGCGSAARTYPLNTDLARSSVEQAMQAWVDGQSPEDLQPEIIVGDMAWNDGTKLISFEILSDREEVEDGSNVHFHVKRTFGGDRGTSESIVKYIVSTSPVITIFPQ